MTACAPSWPASATWTPVPSSLRRPRGALYINPAAIPADIGLSIGVDVASASSYNVGVDLVVTSPRCTGS